ncbi:MAG TPA: AraC family transcriptional regulator [Verrucomicrobiales bacterium]|nr:AraC family transcriptional regulator [Verrucomicrobiales bacterium]HCN77312.1 AraC family transcriptional regulator [Verrucomicrobiales bacterium]HRK14355.1 AraC family transcriptional regulator [Prosthecobacter sp.]
MKTTQARKLSRRDAIFAQAPALEAAEFLFDTVGDVLFCVKDRERRYVAANEAFIRRAGLVHRSDLLGRTAREVFPPILAAGYEQQDDEVFHRGATVRDRLEMITKGGSVGWFVSQKIAVKSLDGGIIALAGISRDLHHPAVSGAELGPLAEVLDTLHRDCASPLRIEALARKAGLSMSQFERRVRGITGLTPRQLLTKSRIEMAAGMLRGSDDALSSIAFECGFYDQAAFSRQFRAATGMSPGEYRRAARE